MMTTAVPPTGSLCTWVIALEYYDGPMTGIALRDRDQMKIFFRAVAWDSEQWDRVFAITPVRDNLVERLRGALAKIEAPKEPFWLPSPATNTPEVTSAWEAVVADAHESNDWSLVESHDLLGAASETALPTELSASVARLVLQGTVRDVDRAPMLPVFLDQLRGARGAG
jgi:hypothetical protein